MEKKHQIIRYLIYFALLIPLMAMRDITPNNELKYLSIADESIADGHIFTMYNHGEPYADKPPLYIWIIMGFKLLLGHHSIFLISLFSLIPAFVIMGIFNKWTERELSEKWRIAAELALLTSVYFLGGSIVLRMDMLMCMFITLAMYTFYRMYEGDNSLKLRIAFPIYIFMALFTKGPVGIMVPLLCIPAFLIINKQFKTIGKYWSWITWLILVVLCGIWFTCVYFEGGTSYLNNLLFHQTIDRAVDAFHHKAPFYYYLYTIWYAAGPWSLLTIGTVIWILIKKKEISPLSEFMLILSASIVVMLSIVSSKLAVYLLPAFGFLTYGTFLVLAKYEKNEWRKTATYISTAILVIVFAAGFFIKNYNSKIGFRDIAAKAKIEAQRTGIDRFGYFELRSGENMDVYLNQQLEKISPTQMQNPDILVGNSNGIIVFTKKDNNVIFYTFAAQNSLNGQMSIGDQFSIGTQSDN